MSDHARVQVPVEVYLGLVIHPGQLSQAILHELVQWVRAKGQWRSAAGK